MKLASDHEIENRLNYREGIDRIYNLLGDYRLTKWFTSISEKELSEKSTWKELLLFLEAELKVHQKKLLYDGNAGKSLFTSDRSSTSEKQSTDKSTSADKRRSQHSSSHHTSSDEPEVQTRCFICNKTDHVSTNGPKGSKLIQYFLRNICNDDSR